MKTDLHQFNYSKWWRDCSGKEIPWPLVDNQHLRNIQLLLARKGTGPKHLEFELPDAAFYFCMMEIKRRNIQGWISNVDEYHINRIKEETKNRIYNKVKEQQMKDAENGTTMKMNQPPTTFTSIEDLANLFGKKVRTKSNGVGIVVGIYHPDYKRTSMNYSYNLKINIETGGTVQCNAVDVDVIQTVKLFLYEDKSGTVEWTSKEKPAATLKRLKTKLLTTKEMDI